MSTVYFYLKHHNIETVLFVLSLRMQIYPGYGCQNGQFATIFKIRGALVLISYLNEQFALIDIV